MRRLRSALLVWLPLALTSCAGGNQDKYAEAAIGTGIVLAATGVNRAVTKDCWARCSPGYLCNQQSGLCELGECYPGCEAGDHCVRDVREVSYCAPDMTQAPPPKYQSDPPRQTPPRTFPESVAVPTQR
jgi:hypothetical protein